MNQSFSYYILLDDRRIQSRIQNLVLMDPDPGGPKTSGSATLLTGTKTKQLSGRVNQQLHKRIKSLKSLTYLIYVKPDILWPAPLKKVKIVNTPNNRNE
jgi:hypothetical protein